MKKLLIVRFALLSLVCLLVSVTANAQEHAPAAAQPQAQTEQRQPENPNSAIGGELAKESREAESAAEHEENAQFKYSPTVKWIAKHLGMDPHAAYFVSLIINFGILALFFYILLRGKIPAMFRDRSNSIHRAIREAQAASAEATARLSQIESRLSKLDTEIAGIRAESEKTAVAEEQRIRASAEEDKRRVVEGAKAEIDSIARNARRDLKSYAASLAVDIAGKRIHVDERSDEALVREFVDQLGKDGR
jgi:F-type H+-transporting ATPase subunit b